MTVSNLFASRYRVLHTIGSGGMGEVCLVEDTLRDNKPMALKTMKDPGDTEASKSFRAEFRHVRGVIHPNIPEVFDFGNLPQPDGRLYFTCEYVNGKPLDTLDTVWTPGQLHTVMVKLCRALAFLHSRGILHRDIKPQNVLAELDDSGDIDLLKMVDFGLASVKGDEAATAGTIDYMAPELIAGGQATVSTDIYAVGMLLFRLATGRMPFAGDDPLAVSRQRCSYEAPPAFRFKPDLPVGLSDVISALIRINPEERPGSARRVIALLNEREGTEFPYETSATRDAYIQSAATAIHVDIKNRLYQAGESLAAGGHPAAIAIVSPKGLGRTRLIHAVASELSLDGISTRIIARDEDTVDDEPAVMIPNIAALSPPRLISILDQIRQNHQWCVLGAEELQADIVRHFGDFELHSLSPLDLDGVRDFINSTFPENAFPEGFAENIYTRTMGFATAVHDALNRLLADEQLRIGLSGWELLPGTWDHPVHPVVTAHIQQMTATIAPRALKLAQALACSQTPLPECVMAGLIPGDSLRQDILSELECLDWIDQSAEGTTLRFSAVQTELSEALADAERDQIHRTLETIWSFPQLRSDPRAKREALFHDFYAGSWHTPPEEAARTLREVLDLGDNRWVRHLIESCLLHDPPIDIWTVMLDALVAVEYTEGHLETSVELLGRILNGGEAEVTEKNLEQLARYAMLEEKLGRTDHAVHVLEHCRAALPVGHDSRAGTVFGTLAWIAFKRGEADEARHLAEEGLVRIPPQSADAGQALLLNTVATLAFYRGDTDAAALFWNRCLEINTAIHDRKGVANMYNNLGVLAAQSGDRLRARALWEKCAEIARDINDVSRLAGIYNNLGIDSLETGQLPEAEEYYLKALALFRRMKSAREQIEILSNLGELAYYRADYARALSYLQEATALSGNVGDREGEIEPLIYLGKLLIALDHLDQAEGILDRACRIAQEIEAKKGEGQAWENIAMLWTRRGREKSALKALERAHTLLSDDLDPLAQLHLFLTECAIAAIHHDSEAVSLALAKARKVADIKWDPFTAARTLVYGLLFARETIEMKERPRILRQLAVYPDLLWKFHWASGRIAAENGSPKKALEEYGRGVTVLKSIAARMSEESRAQYLNSPDIRQFKTEALALKNSSRET
jgi:tetratricopeptide (TPR) repeat protein